MIKKKELTDAFYYLRKNKYLKIKEMVSHKFFEDKSFTRTNGQGHIVVKREFCMCCHVVKFTFAYIDDSDEIAYGHYFMDRTTQYWEEQECVRNFKEAYT